MVSVLNSSTGLSVANIAALFGTTPASSDPDAKDGTKTSAGAASATPITGFGAGTNAAKAIQAIVTQIQMEKIQTKSSSLSFASVSTTYGVQVEAPSGTGFVGLNMTAVDRTASATASDTAGAIGALLDQVNGRAAQIETDQGGALVTEDERILGRGGYTTFLNWTADSATIATKGFSSDGVMTQTEQSVLQGVGFVSSEAQQFQAPSVGNSRNADATSSRSGTNGGALYLEISVSDATDYSALEAQEQELVSTFEKGSLPNQSGTTPENGTGFGYFDNTDHNFGIWGIYVSNYDSSVAAAKSLEVTSELNNFTHAVTSEVAHYPEIVQNVAMGGATVGVQLRQDGELSDIRVVVPLKRS